MRRHGLVSGIDAPVGIAQVQRRFIGQKVHIGLPEAVNGTDVFPVSFKGIGIECYLIT